MTTSVDIQGMQAAQADFQLALDQMNSVYSAMTEEQDNLSASWSGMAASAFGQALGAWLDDLYQIRQELVVMTESLSTHTGIYSDANEASQEVVAAFQQGQGLSALEGLSTEPLTERMRMGVRVRGRLQPETEVRLRKVDAPLPGMEVKRRVEDPLLPEMEVKRRVEEPALPEMEVKRRVEEPLLPFEQGVPDDYVAPDWKPALLGWEQPSYALPTAPIPTVPAEEITPDHPVLPRETLFLKSEKPPA